MNKQNPIAALKVRDAVSLTPDYRIPPDFPVSRSPTGQCLSTYSQWTWDYGSHVPSNKTEGKIHFYKEPYISNQGLLADTKHILWLLIADHFDSKGTHAPSSYLGWASVLLHMSAHCADQSLTLRDCLSLDEVFLNFHSEVCPSSRKQEARSMMGILFRLDPFQIGCVTVNAGHLDFELGNPNEEQQTLVIPSRILSQCITTTNAIVVDFYNSISSLKTLALTLHNETTLHAGAVKNSKAPKIPQTYFNILLDRLGLHSLSIKYNWANAVQFAQYLSTVQFACKTLIHIYSGMRDDEAYSLRPGCYVERTVDGYTGYWLEGYTTKGYGRRQYTAWVTSDSISVAMLACTNICEWMREACNLVGELPIFSNVSHFAFSTSHNRTQLDKNGHKLANLTHFRFNRIFHEPTFLISDEDLEEVKFIEYARDWERETSYIVGNNWHFTTHQFRRSLAYYSVESGLVRFSALHKQLQHQRMRMTVHYTKGGQYADSIIGSSTTHFKHELSRVKPIINALSYVKTIELSSERLLGGHGKHVEKNIKPKGLALILKSRSQTTDQMVKGLISYTPKPSGGCMSSTACHRNLIHPLSACLSCADSALIPSRLKLAVISFKRFVDRLEPDSPEEISARTELEHALNLLKNQKIFIGDIE
ncbi:TPA: hypothetical protein U8251_002864 [Pseudomonas putida]|nr:hypothetical protein [Pseudomonas putida]